MNKRIILLVSIVILLFSCDTPKKYKVIGVIKEINKNDNKILIDHEEIPGFMVKMVMFFKLHNTVDINEFTINDSVSFDLIIKNNDSYTINYNKIGTSVLNTEKDFWDNGEDSKYNLKEPGEYIDNVSFWIKCQNQKKEQLMSTEIDSG